MVLPRTASSTARIGLRRGAALAAPRLRDVHASAQPVSEVSVDLSGVIASRASMNRSEGDDCSSLLKERVLHDLRNLSVKGNCEGVCSNSALVTHLASPESGLLFNDFESISTQMHLSRSLDRKETNEFSLTVKLYSGSVRLSSYQIQNVYY